MFIVYIWKEVILMRAGIYDKYNTREGEREMELGYIFTTYFKTWRFEKNHFHFL